MMNLLYYIIISIFDKLCFIFLIYININIFFGDWGLGIGDWGLGIGPNPPSPIPNPQLIQKKYLYLYILKK